MTYEEIVNRVRDVYISYVFAEPDRDGWYWWADQINSGKATLNDLVATITSSVRYQNIQKLVGAYQTLLQRKPDSGGIEFYLDKMGKGWSITDVENHIKASDEYNTLQQTKKPQVQLESPIVQQGIELKKEISTVVATSSTPSASQPSSSGSGLIFGMPVMVVAGIGVAVIVLVILIIIKIKRKK